MYNTYHKSTKVATTDGETTVLNEAGKLAQVIILTNGTDDATVLLEDGTSEILTLQADGADLMRSVPLAGEIQFSTRLDVTVTGTGASAFILHRK